MAENTLRYVLVSNILGKVLTVIDSAFEDKTRREATKSLIKQLVNDERKAFINEVFNSYKN
ncbi:MAG: hypothetical protein GY932_07790 [Arcobacter sp.]|nr:hypothetical protein [Arcobacter sp.]